jgi:ABC-type nickel/cobalt efflux system permease component RcnA
MTDWLIAWLGQTQGGIIRTLATELRAGSMGTASLAFALGALHALTPGHGKAALAAYFLGREARIGKGLRVTLLAALLHVLSGLAVFIVLRIIVAHGPAHRPHRFTLDVPRGTRRERSGNHIEERAVR